VSTTDNWQPIDDESDDKIFAIFNFKYRSRGKPMFTALKKYTNMYTAESLENLNIIPHDVEPEPKANIGSRATPDFAQRPNTNITTLLYLRLLSYTTTLYTNNILMSY
jgi:hypothetical protein